MLPKSVLLAASAASAWAYGAPAYPLADLSSLIAHDGTPVGTEEVHNGYNLYISKPAGYTNATKAVLYLTDVFGIQLAQNKLLADSFARAGFLTVAPDLFGGSPAPGDINVPGFNTTAFLAQHGPDVTDPIVAAALSYIHSLGAPRVGATGYCYGGRYAFRAAGTLGNTTSFDPVDAVFAAHPSLLSDDEITAANAPASVAAAETDTMMSVARRAEITALLQSSGNEYSFAVYGGTSHGFGVRANVTDPRQKFAKEEAFLQAARWFSVWL